MGRRPDLHVLFWRILSSASWEGIELLPRPSGLRDRRPELTAVEYSLMSLYSGFLYHLNHVRKRIVPAWEPDSLAKRDGDYGNVQCVLSGYDTRRGNGTGRGTGGAALAVVKSIFEAPTMAGKHKKSPIPSHRQATIRPGFSIFFSFWLNSFSLRQTEPPSSLPCRR